MALFREMIAKPQPVPERIGETRLNKNRDRHRKQAEPDGTLWHPLPAETRVGKRTKRMRDEQDAMPDSLHLRSAGNALTWAYGNERAKWRHKGTKGTATDRSGLPVRPLSGFLKEDAGAVKHPAEKAQGIGVFRCAGKEGQPSGLICTAVAGFFR